jgi:hypothetical protein
MRDARCAMRDARCAAFDAEGLFVAHFGLTNVRSFPESFRGAFGRDDDPPICNYFRSADCTRAMAAATLRRTIAASMRTTR